MHIILLGDSIFDNRAYTGREPDVITHLRGILPPDRRATLLAVDGATTRSMASQVSRIPDDATHLVVSVGGNDALGNIDLLHAPARLSSDPLGMLGERLRTFEENYRAALTPVLHRALPTTVCTIYNGALEDPGQAARARLALMLFNDVILRAAIEHRLTAIELRLVCDQAEDYANPIEPSGRGGLKIARAVLRATGLDEEPGHTRVLY
jgi:hypothetical protein